MQRLIWVDILKGVGILCVVGGHIVEGRINALLYLFHMPLFFFIGGFLFRPRENRREYFRAKLLHLGLPYAAFLFVLYAPNLVAKILHSGDVSLRQVAIMLGKPVLGGRWLGGYMDIFWFLPCFFVVQQLANYMVTRFSKKQVLVLTSGMLAMSYLNAIFLPSVRFPLNVNVALGALPLFLAGFLFKDLHERRACYLMAIPLAAVFLILTAAEFPLAYHMRRGDYGVAGISFIAAISVIVSLVFLSKRLAGVPVLAQSLIRLGGASMVIMYVHKVIQWWMKEHLLVQSPLGLFAASAVASFGIYLVLGQFRLSRILFLGSRRDPAGALSRANSSGDRQNGATDAGT